MSKTFKKLSALMLCMAALSGLSCEPAKPPPTRETIHLRASAEPCNPDLPMASDAYARGCSHGKQLKSKIHSFYTTLLTNSLLPYLGREQPDIASLLSTYNSEEYLHGNFGYQMLLDSAKNVEKSLPRAIRDEMAGIAWGADMPYDQVLVLNTFFDSVLAVRGVALAIRLARAPQVQSVEFIGASNDGVDNDGDMMVDEADEGLTTPYIPVLGGAAVEVPNNVKIKVVLKDPDGVDPAAFRVRLADVLYTQGDPALNLMIVGTDTLEATLTPPAALAPGTYSLVLSSGDGKIIDNPPPSHASFMRDEEVTFTVKGTGIAYKDVQRPTLNDGRTRPPPIAIGVRRSATTDGSTLIAQHFALLDANTSYKHTVLFVQHPANGPAFAYVGWAGIIFGMTGMSNRGVGYACNPSDSLNNSVVGSVLENVADITKAKLVAKGVPIGILGRKILETATSAAEAQQMFAETRHVNGWHCLLGDSTGDLSSVEVDSDIFKDTTNNGVFSYTTTDTDALGHRYSSVKDDDMEIASCANKNIADIAMLTLAGQRIIPQRMWSGFFFRSRRAQDALARRVAANYGQIDSAKLEGFISDEELVDKSDSMNAIVIDLNKKIIRSAMGAVPATSVPFETFDLGAEAAK